MTTSRKTSELIKLHGIAREYYERNKNRIIPAESFKSKPLDINDLSDEQIEAMKETLRIRRNDAVRAFIEAREIMDKVCDEYEAKMPVLEEATRKLTLKYMVD